MLADVGLSIFTNSSDKAPEPLIDIIKETYESFCSTFRPMKPIVFLDPMPNVDASEEYYEALILEFEDVRMCRSLADGHYMSIKAHETTHIFHLEHDWKFIPENIAHSLDEIVNTMDDWAVPHLRFNKRSNHGHKGRDAGYGGIEEKYLGSMPVCITGWLSNNPHIINRRLFSKHCLRSIRNRDAHKPGDHERNMSKRGFKGAIYGKLGHPRTVVHLHGRTPRRRKRADK